MPSQPSQDREPSPVLTAVKTPHRERIRRMLAEHLLHPNNTILLGKVYRGKDRPFQNRVSSSSPRGFILIQILDPDDHMIPAGYAVHRRIHKTAPSIKKDIL